MNIAICGFGRAARALAEIVMKSEKYDLKVVICREESEKVGKDIGEILYGEGKLSNINILPLSQIEKFIEEYNVDVIIDFSHRDMVYPLIELCGKLNAKLVICTTNHSEGDTSNFIQMAKSLEIGIVYAPNLTLGINMLIDFVKKMSRVFSDFNFEIIEKHPMGKPLVTNTARIISESIGRQDTPIHSIRLDGYVGVHQVIASNGYEKIVIEHESFSRGAFANGALLAADYIIEKKGFYLMQEVVKDIISQ